MPVRSSHLLGRAFDEEQPLAVKFAEQAVAGRVAGDNAFALASDRRAGGRTARRRNSSGAVHGGQVRR